jgi:hypothetical protein
MGRTADIGAKKTDPAFYAAVDARPWTDAARLPICWRPDLRRASLFR